MYYVERDGNGKIKGSFLRPQYDGQEQVQDNDSDLLIFLKKDIDHLKKSKLETLNLNFTRCSEECRGYYDAPAERETWDQQKKEAEEYTANPLAVTPFMDAFILANPNMTKAQLATTIISNATSMAAAAGDLGGQLSAKRAAVLAAVDKSEIDAVDITFTMPSISLLDK